MNYGWSSDNLEVGGVTITFGVMGWDPGFGRWNQWATTASSAIAPRTLQNVAMHAPMFSIWSLQLVYQERWGSVLLADLTDL
jgi:hypothetical protein